MGHQSPLLTTVFAEQTPTEANADHEIGVWLDAGVITLSTSKAIQGGKRPYKPATARYKQQTDANAWQPS